MIERLLAAESALRRDELDHAEHLYEQVAAADPRNAIAVVGLARVAAQRGDAAAARAHLEHALEIDPEEAAARRLLAGLGAGTATAMEAPPEPVELGREPVAPPPPPNGAPAPPRRSLLGRLLRWLGLRSRS